MKNTDYKISKFILNLIVGVQNNDHKNTNQKLEINSYTLKYVESYLNLSTLSSNLTSPIRRIGETTTILGKTVTIDETLRNGQIRIMPSNTIINV